MLLWQWLLLPFGFQKENCGSNGRCFKIKHMGDIQTVTYLLDWLLGDEQSGFFFTRAYFKRQSGI